MASARKSIVATFVSMAIALVCASEGCGATKGGSGFDNTPSSVQGPGAADGAEITTGDDASDLISDATISTFGDDGSRPPPPSTCHLPGLWCYQTKTCTTTLSGKVFDPAGKNALYNVVVYIPSDPSQPLTPIMPGTNSCNTCDAQIGNYMSVGVTDSKGHFQLTDVPATQNVPVVVQIGKWRKQVFVSNIKACQDNPVGDGALRLPRNHKEGDMPQMGLLTGGCDDLGCFMRSIGIDASEFSAPKGGGRLDIYQGLSTPLGISLGNGPGLSTGTAGNCTGTGCPLWSTKQDLEYYDIVLLACECDENTSTKPMSAVMAMHDWLNEGGKVFATHYHYTWFMNGPADFKGVANWLGTSAGIGIGNFSLDTSFPKGQIFHDWLANLGALTNNAIRMTSVANSVSTVNNPPTTRWIYDPNMGLTADGATTQSETKYLSFLTPIGGIPPSADAGEGASPTYCGKAVFTDLHTSGAPSGDLPGACSGATLTAQQQALEFLLFDLAACVAPENKPPPPPPPPPQPPPT